MILALLLIKLVDLYEPAKEMVIQVVYDVNSVVGQGYSSVKGGHCLPAVTSNYHQKIRIFPVLSDQLPQKWSQCI